MLEVVADRDVWQLNLELLSLQPSQTSASFEEDCHQNGSRFDPF